MFNLLQNKHIYWTDAFLRKIERINYDGSNRTLLLNQSVYLDHPLALTVHKNNLYWIDT